jgi:hypothetical protein
MPASGERAGDILLADSTVFSTLFGGDESLERFWKNLPSAPLGRELHAAERVRHA